MKNPEKMNAEQFMEDMRRLAEYPLTQAAWSPDVGETFGNIRRAYRQFEARVNAGLESWFGNSQYDVGDWVLIFSPIEQEAWYHIRRKGLAMWPQLPVDRFFVDFGNPIAKVALECDGARFHDAKKDAARDTVLRDLGWTVFRVPGWQCFKDVELPSNYHELNDDDQHAVLQRAREQTILPVMDRLADYLRFGESTG